MMAESSQLSWDQIWALIQEWWKTINYVPPPITIIAESTNPLTAKLAPRDKITTQLNTLKNDTLPLLQDPELIRIWPSIQWDQLRTCMSSTDPNQTWEDYLQKTGTVFQTMNGSDLTILREHLPGEESAVPNRKSELKLLGIQAAGVDLLT